MALNVPGSGPVGPLPLPLPRPLRLLLRVVVLFLVLFVCCWAPEFEFVHAPGPVMVSADVDPSPSNFPLGIPFYLSDSSSSGAFPVHPSATFTLDLLHTAQLYGRLGPVTLDGSAPDTECNQAETVSNAAFCPSAGGGYSAGGFARLASYIKQARQAYQQTPTWSVNAATPLYVDVGDVMFSSMLYNARKVAPFPGLLQQLGVDVITHALSDMLDSAQLTAQFDDFLFGSIPIVISNLNATGNEWLNSHRPNTTYQSASPSKYDEFHVLNVTINGNPNTTVQVGFVGCLDEQINVQSSITNIQVPGDPESSVRVAVQHMLARYPTVNVIIMLSSCSGPVNTRLARNVIELDVIVENNAYINPIYSNTEIDPNVVSKYPKVITNNVQQPCLLVASGRHGARIGHLAVQFNNKGQPVSWFGDSILLSSSYGPDPAMLESVSSFKSIASSFSDRVIGSSIHDIGAHSCWSQECAAGNLIADALLWACKDCQVAVTNGGGIRFGLFPSSRGSNLTVGDTYLLSPFTSYLATLYLPGIALLKTLQVGLDQAIPGSFTQVAGMRYAYSTDSSLDPSVRISQVEIWSNFAQDYVPLKPTQSYKVATSDYLAGGGEGHSEFVQYGQSINKFGPLVRDLYEAYITAMSPLNRTSQDMIDQQCVDTTYTAQTIKGKTVWPNPLCRTVAVSSSVDFLSRCPTSPDIVLGQVMYDGMIAGVSVINSTMQSCSGLGRCALQTCTCGMSTSGLYQGKQLIRGSDCSDVRVSYSFSSVGRIALILLSILVMLISLLTGVFYFKYRYDSMVRASSPLFMHVACCGTILVAISVIISLVPLTNGICVAQYWTLACGFGITFGALFAKTYRLYRIFHQREMKVVHISNMNVLSIVCGVVLIELLILLIFQILSPLQLAGTLMDNGELSWAYTTTCSARYGQQFAITLFAFNCALLVVGSYLSWELRHIEGPFNETKYLAMAIYHTTLVTCIVLPLVYVFHDTYPTFVLAFRSVFILYCAAFVLLCVTIPKYITILTRLQQQQYETEARSISATDILQERDRQSNRQREQTIRTQGRQGQGQGLLVAPDLLLVQDYYTKSRSQAAHDQAAGAATGTHLAGDEGEWDEAGLGPGAALRKIEPTDVPTRVRVLSELLSDAPLTLKQQRLEQYIHNTQLYVQELTVLLSILRSDSSPAADESTEQQHQQQHAEHEWAGPTPNNSFGVDMEMGTYMSTSSNNGSQLSGADADAVAGAGAGARTLPLSPLPLPIPASPLRAASASLSVDAALAAAAAAPSASTWTETETDLQAHADQHVRIAPPVFHFQAGGMSRDNG